MFGCVIYDCGACASVYTQKPTVLCILAVYSVFALMSLYIHTWGVRTYVGMSMCASVHTQMTSCSHVHTHVCVRIHVTQMLSTNICTHEHTHPVYVCMYQ